MFKLTLFPRTQLVGIWVRRHVMVSSQPYFNSEHATNEITLQMGKEDIVIGISLVPVACRVVFRNMSAYERAGQNRREVPFGETTRPRPLEAPRYTVSIMSINLR